MTEEKQIDLISKIIARKSKDYRNPNVAFMTTAKKSASTIYHEFCKMQSEAKQSENTVELPCKVGDKVWCIYNYTKPKEFRITTLTISENHYAFVIEADKGIYKHYCDKDSVGKYVFFTKEEAEAKMKGGAE